MPGIPFFEASELAGARDVLHEKLSLHPLDAIFPTQVHEGSAIEVDVKVHTPYAADPTDRGEPTPYADPHDFRTVRAEPVQLRNGRRLSNKEISFFRRYGQLRQTSGVTETQEARRSRHITDITREVMLPPEERKHVMQAEALQGSVTLNIGGVSQAFSYGLNDLTVAVGSPDWSLAAADIVQDVYKIKGEFEDAGNVPPDTVIFNQRMFESYFIGNTEFTDYVKASPRLSEAFAGFAGSDGRLTAMEAPRTPFTLFGLTWIPITGNYVDTAGNTTARWPLTRLGLIALNAGDGQRVLEWANTMDEYQPRGTPEFRTWSTTDPIGHMVEYTEGGVPMIYIRERVQFLDIA
jgi:hypothetical protein